MEKKLDELKLRKGTLAARAQQAKAGGGTEALGARGQVNFAHLSELVPDIRLRDVYVAGGETFVDHVVTTLHHLGLSPRSIHFEVYAL